MGSSNSRVTEQKASEEKHTRRTVSLSKLLSRCSIKHDGRIHPNKFKVVRIRSSIDKKPTQLDERSNQVLKYKTPHFRAHACVEVPALKDKESVQIGWIQTCTLMHFINRYGHEGITSWEFPEIVSGKYSMVSDADGRFYPWYGCKNEVCHVRGPCEKQQVTVDMNDNFFPQITWSIPVSGHSHKAKLNQIHRKQKFNTHLALKNLQTGEVHTLKTIRWSFELNIAIDMRKPFGERCRILAPFDQEQPKILETAYHIPTCALHPPNANHSQVLVWRPSFHPPVCVVPPEESTVDIQKYLEATKDMNQKLLDMLP